MTARLMTAIATVLVVAIGIRVASWIVEPVLGTLTAFLLLVLVVLTVVGGPRSPR